MQLRLHQFELELAQPFKIARDSYDRRQTLIVELYDGKYSGFGEAIAHSYYGVDVTEMKNELEALRPQIESYLLKNPEDFYQFFLQKYFSEMPFLRCALDEAAHDIWAQRLQLPLYAAWGLSLTKRPLPVSNFTIGIGTVDEMMAKIEAQPNPIYKIKLGTPNDLEIVENLKKYTSAALRVDANCGWTVAETIYNSKYLKQMNVEFIEQPLAAEAWEEMEEVFAKSKLPIVADESCRTEQDVAKCHRRFHGINIKLVKCGGLTPARRMIADARCLDMQVMVGCMTESSVGISAIAHLLPLLDCVDMDGALLLRNDPASGVTLDFGKAIFTNKNGIGCSLK